MTVLAVNLDMLPARILVVDDNESVRKALRRLLTSEDIVVCGEAVDGLDAIDAVRRLTPDLLVMDVSMPRLSGMDAARAVHHEFPALPILLMTDPDPEIVAAGRRLGVGGFVSKTGNIAEAARTVLRGEEFA
jgi:DNA-binding NarL/FixJ family response regulator